MKPEKAIIESAQTGRIYEFGPFRLVRAKRLLLREGEVVPLRAKVFDTLLMLVENSGKLVSKDELMSRLWPDTFVEESGLTRNISDLRKVLGENPQEHQYIVTVPGQGYRFVAPVRDFVDESADVRVREWSRTSVILTEETNGQSECEQPSDQQYPSSPQTASQIARTVTTNEARNAKPPAGSFVSLIKQNRKTAIAFAATLLIALAAIVLTLQKPTRQDRSVSRSVESSRNITVTLLSTTGNITCAAISPDGKYIAYGASVTPRLSSLHVRQLAAPSSQTIIPSAEVIYHGLTFSPDGNFIYYVAKEKEAPILTLYQVPMLGGPAKKLIEDVDSRVSFSPDGKRFVFRRISNARREDALIVADADGIGQQEIAAISEPEDFGDPAWSPDGKVIACTAGHADGGANKYVVEIRVGDWTIKPVSAQRWRWVGQIEWLSDSSGLQMIASDHPQKPYQIWQLSYPGGEAQRLTDNYNSYNRMSLTADSSKMVVIEMRLATNVWTVPADDTSQAKQITFGTGGYKGGISWTPEGKLVFASLMTGLEGISMMSGVGDNVKQLTGEMAGRISGGPAITPDGRHILFASDHTGARHIWRMNIDGSNPLQLTNGGGEDSPACTPDGRWVIYTDISSDRPTLCRVSIDGGQAVQLTQVFSRQPAISPDGKFVACFYSDEQPNSWWRMAVFPIEGGEPVMIFPQAVQTHSSVGWTADGGALTYVHNREGVSNIWIQPLDGGKPRQMTEFKADRIFGFGWSRDGKRLACVRGMWATDIVLISGLVDDGAQVAMKD